MLQVCFLLETARISDCTAIYMCRPSSMMDFFNVLPFAKQEGGGEESDSSCHSSHEGKL